jgi:hypothetical protein
MIAFDIEDIAAVTALQKQSIDARSRQRDEDKSLFARYLLTR